MIELLRLQWLQFILHIGVVSHTHEVVIPRALRWHHKEAQKSIREQHLHTLIMTRQVAFGVIALIRVLSTPFIAARGEFVGTQRH